MAFNMVSKFGVAALLSASITGVLGQDNGNELVERVIADATEAVRNIDSADVNRVVADATAAVQNADESEVVRALAEAAAAASKQAAEFNVCLANCGSDTSKCTHCFVNPAPAIQDVLSTEDCVVSCNKLEDVSMHVSCYSNCFARFVQTGGNGSGDAGPNGDGQKGENGSSNGNEDGSSNGNGSSNGSEDGSSSGKGSGANNGNGNSPSDRRPTGNNGSSGSNDSEGANDDDETPETDSENSTQSIVPFSLLIVISTLGSLVL